MEKKIGRAIIKQEKQIKELKIKINKLEKDVLNDRDKELLFNAVQFYFQSIKRVFSDNYIKEIEKLLEKMKGIVEKGDG